MKTKSFTLIELLVVIVIIGILSGVIVISTTNYINDTQNTKIVAELSTLSKSFEGYANYYVGSLCIEDTANNTAFLNYYGLSKAPVHPNYTEGETSLTTNNCYLYFSDGTNYSIRTPSVGNKGYLIQESRHPQTKPIQKTCETGWIPFGNRCVMQYEARAKNDIDSTIDADGLSVVLTSNSPTSTGEGRPWREISQIQAKAECESIGAHLITNAEWMALARDIEQVKENWTGGAVGSGMIKRGNVGVLDAGSYAGGDPETGILNDKAKLKLSNGEDIYHFSGNVWEALDQEIPSQAEMLPTVDGWQEINYVTNWGKTGLFYSEVGPKTRTLDSGDGIGKIWYRLYLVTSRAVQRGGPYSHTSSSGIFSMDNISPLYEDSLIMGFRCVK